MNLIDFQKRFPNEDYCREHLKSLREKQASSVRSVGVNTTIGKAIVSNGSANAADTALH